MAAKKHTPQKKKPSDVKNDIKSREKEQTQKKDKRNFGMWQRILPFVLILFSVILAICFITVKVLDMKDGAGVVGYYVQALFCALLGGAAYTIPAILMYIGVKKCVFNIKWAGIHEKSEKPIEYLEQRRRITRQSICCGAFALTFSSFLGVIADQGTFDLLSFWTDGVECIGGGLIGGSVACLFLFCVQTVISIIILSVLMLFFLLLSIGITPYYILTRVRERQLQKAELRAEERERLREHDIKEAQARIKGNRPEIRDVPAQKPKKLKAEMSVDEMLDDAPFFDEPELKPLPRKVTEEITPEPEIPIGPSVKEADGGRPVKKVEQASSEPMDFGGDPAFDTNEFSGIGDIFKDLGTPIAPSASPVAEKPVEQTPVAEARSAEPRASEFIDEEDIPLDLTEIESGELLEDMAAVTPDEGEEDVADEVLTPYVFPPFDLLSENKDAVDEDYSEELQANAKVLVETLKSFRVGIKEVTYSRGPTITRYELKPEVGTRVRSIANLVDDIALNLATSGVRIEAPIPNKPAVGIEVPNKTRATVYLRDLIESNKFIEAKSRLTASLGMDVGGNPIYFDVAKMPHLLIAGTTGSGKSICINCIIISLLYKAKPEDVKLILIDPKKVEFNMYKSIPHLYCPIVSEPKKAAGALASAGAEMERRFELIESVGVRDIASYNAATENDPDKEYMPQMVIIIDELADLMMTARDEVETSICRLAQKARAAGIHVILGTQRPSVDVITGLIKANVPSRIACTVTSQVDSRTIIDVAGAENLIGRGDMLFSPVGSSKPMRVQGAFVSDGEVERIVNFISENNGKAKYNEEFIHRIDEEAAKCGQGKKGTAAAIEDMPEPEGGDSKFRDAVKLAIETGKISTSLMQRRLGVGYGRAAKIIDTMEQMGYVSKPDGNKPRQVLITMEEYMRRVMDGELGEMED